VAAGSEQKMGDLVLNVHCGPGSTGC